MMKRLACGLVLLGSFYLLTTYTELGVNRTASLSHKLFLTLKGLDFKKGDLVTIKGHHPKYYTNVRFTKRVVGVGGDAVTIQNNHIFINTHKIGGFFQQSSFGETLTPLVPQTIPEGHVFVATNHPRSFDSRYEEFGLVSTDNIIGRAIVLW